MDKAMIEQRLNMAEHHVALGEQYVSMQRDIVAMLELRNSEMLPGAANLLRILEDMQLSHASHRDRLERELANSPTEPKTLARSAYGTARKLLAKSSRSNRAHVEARRSVF